MFKRVALIIEFNRSLAKHALHVREMIASSVLLIVLGGVAISKLEGIPLSDGSYFAFITGLTIGYGDIVPETTWGRVVSVAIGFIGMLLTGLMVAIANRALADTFKK